jgi:hypothetical protein
LVNVGHVELREKVSRILMAGCVPMINRYKRYQMLGMLVN